MNGTIPERRGLNLPDRLPPLRGRGLAIFGVAWSMLFLVAVAGIGYGAWADFRPQTYSWAYFGISVDSGIVNDVVPETEAAAQGIARDQTVLAVDGIPLARLGNTTAAVGTAVQRPEGTALAVTLRDLDGNIVTHRLTRRAVNVRRYVALDRLGGLSLTFNSALMLAAGLILFRQRREPVPALMSLSFTVLAISNALSFWSAIGIDINFLNTPAWSSLLLSVLVFPDGRIQSRWAWLTAAATVVFVVTDFWMADDILSWIAQALLFAAVAAHLAFRYRGLPGGIERQQVRWAFLGIVSGLGSYAAAIGLFSAFRAYDLNDEPWLRGIGLLVVALGTTCIVTGLIVSLTRYRLYDADAVIGRSAAYGVLTLGFVALFAGGEKIIEVVGERYFGEGLGVSAAGLAAGVAAALIVPMHHRVAHWAEHRFQKALIRLRAGVPLLVGDMRETASPERIAAAIIDATIAGVHATHAALLIDGAVLASCGVQPETITGWQQDNDPAERERTRDLFPTRVPLAAESTGRIGWFLLGPRPDGTPVGKDEREALMEIAGPIARAMEIARARERREAASNALLASIEARLALLEKGMKQVGAGNRGPLTTRV